MRRSLNGIPGGRKRARCAIVRRVPHLRLRAAAVAQIRFFLLALACAAHVPAGAADSAAAVEEGRQLAFDRKKGNCLSCHMIPGAEEPGNIAVALLAMKSRFPDREMLRRNVWDQTEFRPHAMMPPFGKHGILSEDEIDKIVAYLYTL